MGAKKAIEAAPKGNLNQVVASLGWRKFGLPAVGLGSGIGIGIDSQLVRCSG